MKDDRSRFNRKDATTATRRTISESELAELREIAMSAEPTEVDLARLKAAVSAGRYRPDLDSLATRMLWDSGAVADLLSE